MRCIKLQSVIKEIECGKTLCFDIKSNLTQLDGATVIKLQSVIKDSMVTNPFLDKLGTVH